MNSYEKKMLGLLAEGRSRYGVVAVKAEFEAEGTRSDELLRLLEIARRAGVKVGLKIGGCEAIRDLHEARRYGVDYIIAPMVETPYALSKFIAAKDKHFSADERGDIGFLFNLETITGFNHLADMARIAARGNVGIVFGRGDFAGSLGKDRSFENSEGMTDYVEKAAAIAGEHKFDFVVGGGISGDAVSALRRVRRTYLSRFETRKIIFDAAALKSDDVNRGLELAIEFELLWLQNKRDHYNAIGSEDRDRIEVVMKRSSAGTAPAVLSIRN